MVTLRVRDGIGSDGFIYSAVYASPHPTKRRALWEYLYKLALVVKGPWVLARDFNAILDVSYQSGGSLRVQKRCILFQNFVFDHCLRDLGCIGSNFTWSHGGISQHLHKAICNAD